MLKYSHRTRFLKEALTEYLKTKTQHLRENITKIAKGKMQIYCFKNILTLKKDIL